MSPLGVVAGLHGEQHHKRASRRKTTPQQAVFDSAAFGGGLCIGILSHILLDMLYMKSMLCAAARHIRPFV